MLKKLLNNEYLNLSIRILIGGLFIFTAISKLADLTTFAKEIENYNILPFYLINIFSTILPWVELLCGLFILTGIRLKANAIISVGLYSVFTIAILIAMLQGLSIHCGCHTKILADKVGLEKVLQNTGLLLLSFYLFFYPVGKLTFERLINSQNHHTEE
ncbi:MAG: DoxX family membrane protein [Ignavibacteriae bacterium]|nr:DoxX family membrane protein [Ignavibacteriota bacterium]